MLILGSNLSRRTGTATPGSARDRDTSRTHCEAVCVQCNPPFCHLDALTQGSLFQSVSRALRSFLLPDGVSIRDKQWCSCRLLCGRHTPFRCKGECIWCMIHNGQPACLQISRVSTSGKVGLPGPRELGQMFKFLLMENSQLHPRGIQKVTFTYHCNLVCVCSADECISMLLIRMYLIT